jgi:hypothetical protein
MPDETDETEDEMTPTARRIYWIEEATEALFRYGGAPPFDEFAYLLHEIADLNDDIWNTRHLDIIREDGEKAKRLIDQIVKLAEEHQK